LLLPKLLVPIKAALSTTLPPLLITKLFLEPPTDRLFALLRTEPGSVTSTLLLLLVPSKPRLQLAAST
jgi:hypothetical protein